MAHTLLPDRNALCLDHVALEGDVIVFHVATTAKTAACPACGCPSARIHSRYRRTLQDLPWQGRIEVSLTAAGGTLAGSVRLPNGVSGKLRVFGAVTPLHSGMQTF